MSDADTPTYEDRPVPLRAAGRASATISISWSGLAFGAGALALASISSLAIVTTLSKVDALATIALALAILSFIIQIGLFIAQSWTSGQQVLHSEELNSDTRAILAEVRENARGTNQMISDQFEKVLTHLLDTTKRTVDESIKGPEAQILNERLDRELRNTLRARLDAPTRWPGEAQTQPARTPTPEELQRLAILQAYPSDPEELAASQALIHNISPQGIIDLNRFGEDEIKSIRSPRGYTKGLFQSLTKKADELLDAGLIEKVEAPTDWRDKPQYSGQEYFVLTDKGRQAARLITGQKNSDDRRGSKMQKADAADSR